MQNFDFLKIMCEVFLNHCSFSLKDYINLGHIIKGGYVNEEDGNYLENSIKCYQVCIKV